MEKEEIIRDIKDSLWESIGMTPSYARQIRNEQMRDAPDQSSKGIKALKKDVEILSIKIELLGVIIGRLNREYEPDLDIDLEISQALEVDPLQYTSDLDATLTLFLDPPHYVIEHGIEIAGDRVDCLSVLDESTSSRTQRVLRDTEEPTLIVALCAIAVSIRRDLLVKRLREISGYNLSNTRIPATERNTTPIDEFGDDARSDFLTTGTVKRKGRKKTTE